MSVRLTLDEIPASIRTELGDRHVEHLLGHPWGLAVATDRAKTCSIRPETTRPAYAELARLMRALR